MEGMKLKNSKRAIKKIIKHLSPKDTLHFVVYDDKADIVFENGDLNNKESLKDQVRSMKTRGSTNIELGMTTIRC